MDIVSPALATRSTEPEGPVLARALTPGEWSHLERLRTWLRTDGTDPRDAAALDARWARLLADAGGDAPASEGVAAAVGIAVGDLLVAAVPGTVWMMCPGPDGATPGVLHERRPHMPVLPVLDAQARRRTRVPAWTVDYVERASTHLRVAAPGVPTPHRSPEAVSAVLPARHGAHALPDAPLDDAAWASAVSTLAAPPSPRDTSLDEDPSGFLVARTARHGAETLTTAPPAPDAVTADAVPVDAVTAAVDAVAVADEPVVTAPAGVVASGAEDPDTPTRPTPAAGAASGADAYVPRVAAPPTPGQGLPVGDRRPLTPDDLPYRPSEHVQDLALRALELALERAVRDQGAGAPFVLVREAHDVEVLDFEPSEAGVARAREAARSGGYSAAAVAWTTPPDARRPYPRVVVDASSAGRPGIRVAHSFAHDGLGAREVGGPEVVGQSAPVL